MAHRDSSIWGPYGARLLSQFDRDQESGDGLDLKEQGLEDREEGLAERGRHNRVTEQIAAAHLDIAAEQEAAKRAVEAVKAHLATEQAVQVQQAAEAIVGLDPKKETYGRDLAAVTGKYPYAFAGAANGLGEGLIKAVNSLNQQNEIWEHSVATHQAHNEELYKAFADKGMTPVDADGKPVKSGDDFDLDKTRKAFESAQPPVPAGFAEQEQVRTDPVTGVKSTFKTTVPLPKPVETETSTETGGALDPKTGKPQPATVKTTVRKFDAPAGTPAVPATRPPLDDILPIPEK